MIATSADALQSDACSARPDLALVSLMQMMSRFTSRPSAAIAGSIRVHLRMVTANSSMPIRQMAELILCH